MLESLDTLISFVLIMLVVSLLITIVVQMVSGLLNLRGLNLAIGLSETLRAIAPELGDRVRALTVRVLTDPKLSDSSIGRSGPRLWRLATAVRPEEVFAAFHRFATDARSGNADLRDDARSVLVGLGVDPAVFTAADQQATAAAGAAQGLRDAVQAAADALPPAEGQKLRDAMTAARTQLDARVARAVNSATASFGAADQAYHKFEYWFESVQDRAQQWFTMHTRYFTVFFAVIFAGWFQLDTVEIYKTVSGNRAVRDQLVAQSGVVDQQARRLLADGQSVLQEAFTHWLAGQDQDTRTRLANLQVGLSDTRGSFRAELAAALASNPHKQQTLAAFDAEVDGIVNHRLTAQVADFKSLRTALDHTGFELLPAKGKGRWGKRWSHGFSKHWLGMLFSAGLLSLGAPFWYNALKNLTNLRSTVAQSISEERKQDAPPTSHPSSPAPPVL